MDYLVARGDQVTAVDNLISAGEYHNSKAIYKIIDIEDFVADETFDETYHLASPASPPIYQEMPLPTISANTNGLKIAMECSRKTLFASTSEIYGSPTEHPQKETYWGNVNPVGPRSCYDESKRLGETLSYVYSQSGYDVRIVRIFNTYGPRMNPDDGRVMINFIEQAKKGLPLVIYGDGKQTRSFCYVDDMVRGLVAAMGRGQSGEVYNLGNPEEVTIKELAEKIADLFGLKHLFEYQSLPQDDPPKRCPDIEKAIKELKWKPEISLEEGLKKLL